MIIATLLFLMLLPADADGATRLDRPISEADCVFAVYFDDWSYAPRHGPRLILALWGDGHIVWSRDQVRGGPPYRSGEIDANRLPRLLDELKDAGAFDDPKLPWSWVPFASDFTTIFARSKGREGVLRSRHEIGETYQGPEFQRFSATWDKVRRRAAALIPRKSVAVRGELILIRV